MYVSQIRTQYHQGKICPPNPSSDLHVSSLHTRKLYVKDNNDQYNDYTETIENLKEQNIKLLEQLDILNKTVQSEKESQILLKEENIKCQDRLSKLESIITQQKDQLDHLYKVTLGVSID